jgi:hypothetical protein
MLGDSEQSEGISSQMDLGVDSDSISSPPQKRLSRDESVPPESHKRQRRQRLIEEEEEEDEEELPPSQIELTDETEMRSTKKVLSRRIEIEDDDFIPAANEENQDNDDIDEESDGIEEKVNEDEDEEVEGEAYPPSDEELDSGRKRIGKAKGKRASKGKNARPADGDSRLTNAQADYDLRDRVFVRTCTSFHTLISFIFSKIVNTNSFIQRKWNLMLAPSRKLISTTSCVTNI